MKKTIKTKDALAVYNVLAGARFTKMDDADKVRMWRITRQLKPVATRYDEDSKDAAEKMKPTDDFSDRLQKAQEYERLRQKGEPTIDVMTTAEYTEFVSELRKYNRLVSDTLEELAGKEEEFDFEPLSEDAFGKLLASNDGWTGEQVTVAGDFVCG